MSSLRPLLACLLLTGSVVACSVINSFDTVVPAKTAGGGAGGSAGASMSGNGGGTVENGGGMAASAGDAGTGAGGATGTPARGLLAVAGTDPEKMTNVVSLIDPSTGSELARQTVTGGAAVAGLAYDGASNKDVWYELTAGSFPADPTDRAALQVYAFNDDALTWKTVSTKTLPGLPPPRPKSFVVLNDRLAYLSYDIAGNAPVDSLTVLDTSDPKAVKLLKDTTFSIDGEVLGMVGTRGVLGDPTATGGTLAVLIGSACTGKTKARACLEVQLLPVTVSDTDVSQGVAVKFSQTLVGEPAFSSAQTVAAGYVAFTPKLGNTVSLFRFDPRKLQDITPATPANNAPWTGGLAYAECQDVALFTGVAEQKLYSVTGDGLNGEADLGHAGQSVVYEPYTRHAITLYNADNAEFADNRAPAATGEAGGSSVGSAALSSFDVTNKAVLTPSAAADWNPPTNLAPNIAVARFPVSYLCN